MSLLYSFSPSAPLWPADPLYMAALPTVLVPVEFHDHCPPCSMVKKTFGSPEGLRGGRVTRQCWLKNMGVFSRPILLVVIYTGRKLFVETLIGVSSALESTVGCVLSSADGVVI